MKPANMVAALAGSVSGGRGDIFAWEGGAVERWRLNRLAVCCGRNIREEQRLERVSNHSSFRSAANKRFRP